MNGYFNYKDELYHHGVLGMKWGVRKAQKKGTTYQYKSRATKKREKRADKYEKKYGKNSVEAKRLRARAEASQKFDDRQVEFAKTASTGKNIFTKVLLGIAPARTYDMARSEGYSKGRSLAKSIIDINGGFTGLSIQQYEMRENYIDRATGQA